MEKVIRLYNYVDEGSFTPFPSIEEQVEIFAFDYHADRMGGAPSINAKVKHRLCLDNLWNDKVYAEFNGERFFVVNTPSSSKDNSDERYVHDVQMLSERDILNHVYFIDAVQLDETLDRPKSNTTKVQFMGDLGEFVARLNASMSYANIGYNAMTDVGISTESKLISFDGKYIASALQEAFTQYGIPYYFVGKTIHFGYTEDAIPDVMRYGHKDALLGISKQNANHLVINRITGEGSSDNIPYYYPNESDDRASIVASGKKWITPSQNLMPPIYRNSFGYERFYNAVNDTYQDQDGDYYTFENEYSEGKQLEGKVDFPEIKPTIVGMTNARGERIDQFIEFAYDDTDDDSYDDEKNEYTHSYFFAKMRKTDGDFGFNLFDQANEKQTMVVSMTSGVCGACSFEIGVGEKTKKNIVQVDEKGNLLRDENGNVIRSGEPQPRQNNTQSNEVWIALKKDDTTYSSFKPMPNATASFRPLPSDTFVLIGITMPQAYIDAAEKKLEDSLIKYMWMNNKEKFNISIKFSRIYLQEHKEILDRLNENSRLVVSYNGQEYPLYVDSFTYKMNGSDSLPEIEVNLVDTLSVGKNSLQTALDSVKQDILSSIGGADFLKQGLKYFLRKDVNDYARGLIRLLGGAEFGNFIKDSQGASIDTLGNIIAQKIMSHGYKEGLLGSGFTLENDPKTNKSYMEVDELMVRARLFFDELKIKHMSYAGGNWIFSPAGTTCSRIEDKGTCYRCYFEDKNNETAIANEFEVDDQVLYQEFEIKGAKNRRYWRRCVGIGDNYIDLSVSDAEQGSDVPQKGDSLITLGNWTKSERQNAIIISAYGEGSPSITQNSGIGKIHFSMKDTEYARLSPKGNLIKGEFIIEGTGKNVSSELESIPEKISLSVKENIGNMELGSVNLVPNSKLDNLEGWKKYLYPEVVDFEGFNCVRCDANGEGIGMYSELFSGILGNVVCSVDIYVDSDSPTKIDFGLTDNKPIELSVKDVKKWVRIVQKVNVTRNNSELVCKLKETGKVVYFKNIKLERGVVATDWSPTPNDLYSAIEVNSNAIKTKVSSTDYNGKTISSLINQEADNISISASKIDLRGAVSFSSLTSELKGDIDDSMKSSTYIDGGKIKTEYINADGITAKNVTISGNITATSGNIGGFHVGENKFGDLDNKIQLTPNGFKYRDNTRFIGVGESVPPSSGVSDMIGQYMKVDLNTEQFMGDYGALSIVTTGGYDNRSIQRQVGLRVKTERRDMDVAIDFQGKINCHGMDDNGSSYGNYGITDVYDVQGWNHNGRPVALRMAFCNGILCKITER